MYLVKMNDGDKIMETANEVKALDKNKIVKIYSLTEVDYNSVVSTSDIRDCIYNYLKGEQMEKDVIVDYVSKTLDVKKNEVSKVITAMKKEKIIYVVEEFGWLGID